MKTLKTPTSSYTSVAPGRNNRALPVSRATHFLLSLFLTAVLLSASFPTHAQKRPSDKLFSQLAGQEGITSMSFSQSMIEMIEMELNEDEPDEKKVTGPLEEIKMVICNTNQAPGVSDKITGFMMSSAFRELKDEDVQEDDCRIFVRRRGNRVHACHVLFHGEQNLVMLSFFGKFKVEDVGQLEKRARQMKQ